MKLIAIYSVPFVTLLLHPVYAQSTTTTSSSATTEPTTSSSSTAPVPTLSLSGPATGYTYQGCYNDTVDLPDTRHVHALTDEVWVLSKPSSSSASDEGMTVQKCLDHCTTLGRQRSDGSPYTYAGLQYSRECYCGDRLSSLAVEVVENAEERCDTPCDGDENYACGGAGALSLYHVDGGEGNHGGSLRCPLISFRSVLHAATPQFIAGFIAAHSW